MKIFLILATMLVFGAGGLILYQNNKDDSVTYSEPIQNQQQINTQQQVNKENCVSDECLQVENIEYPVSTLPGDVESALLSALDDEYKAQATYEAVLANLGQISPFSMIIRAEESHITSLKALFDKYGLAIPENPYTNIVIIGETKVENCQIGVKAEIANAGLYNDSLLPAVSDYPDITTVFTSLMNASQNNHLPAFEKCAN